MTDLTTIYCTAGKIPEGFAENVRQQILKAIGKAPLISISKQPLDFGLNIVEDGESSINNYYRAMLLGAKTATTPYIALCEDDTLYPDEHFYAHRPPLDTFAYNFSRWNLYTWSDPPFFSLRQRRIIASLIAPRELFIEAISERFAKNPNPPEKWMGEPGRNEHEKAQGITQRKSETFMTYSPLVVFSHENSFGYESTGKNKGSNKIRALELPHWGSAEKVKGYYE